ncbi:hypothetical protein ANO11243_049400 [Dothideomycetidae sp. 11243]|nr:hypothetical protein ANO11243_049400 [fungal sp. No.11243]
MDAIPTWFEGVRCNFAENMLYYPDPKDPSIATCNRKQDRDVACTEVREGGTEMGHYTWRELRRRVGLLANAMRARGVKKGDRVAVVAANSIDTMTVFYAITSLGGIFSSSSTDMGTQGVLDRLLQIRPKYVFVDDGVLYNGKTVDMRSKMEQISHGMKSVSEFSGLVSIPRWRDKPLDTSSFPSCETLVDFMSRAKGDDSLKFERVRFRDPFLIVYSSGTTGMPKCIVHCVGGILLNTTKEQVLYGDCLRYSSKRECHLQYTTTGWIMYLLAVSAHLHGARVVLYDGSPFHPDPQSFIRLIAEQRVTQLGISPRYLHTLTTATPSPILPRGVADLSHLRLVTSTGSVLSEAQFEWFYTAFPAHTLLANMSGGTDLVACIVMYTTSLSLYAGGFMTPGLGIRAEIYDADIDDPGHAVQGRRAPPGDSGELVITAPFPSMPVKFWGDEGGEKYRRAYFARFDGVWTHGDFLSENSVTGQYFIHGRSDGVLNPSGVRFGSAEIYNVVARYFADEVQDSLCVGQRRKQDSDESVMLFLLMKPGRRFSLELVRRVKDAVARDCGKRCVPKYVFETPEIPVSGRC